MGTQIVINGCKVYPSESLRGQRVGVKCAGVILASPSLYSLLVGEVGQALELVIESLRVLDTDAFFWNSTMPHHPRRRPGRV
jgi:hypothetical protein